MRQKQMRLWRRRPPTSRGDKWFLIGRDGRLCYLCGEPSHLDDPLVVEHVIPLARGGSDSVTNKRLAHRSCNLLKGTQ
jgi:5-methylcytosine-specific restriction endonuclease McrA